jgi:hypothetical protein
MKVKNFLLAILFLLSLSLSAKTITVSNNANSPGQFTDVQTAINDANTMAGDVIIIQGSPTTYNNFTVSKSIKIYGAGTYPNTPSGTRSVVSNLVISANNVTISGMHMSSISFGSTPVTGTRIEFNSINSEINMVSNSHSNTIIINNRVAVINMRSYNTNVLILNNVLGRFFNQNAGGVFTNVVIKNNVFRTGSDATTNINYGNGDAFEAWAGGSSLNVYDNVFYKPSLGFITNTTFSNNIFTTITTGTVSANSNTNVNNVFGMTQPHGNNFNGSQSEPANYDLGATTGATVTSSDGTQVGVNGGGITFAMRAEAPMPYIRPVFNVLPVIVQSGGTLNVTVTATNGNQ